MMIDNSIKDLCLNYNNLIISNGLAVDCFGNCGLRYDDYLIIKPSGVNLSEISLQDISVVDISTGNHVYGLKPSSDTPTYVELLREFSSINAIVHTHSLNATVWSQFKVPIPCLGTTHADYWKHEIPVTRELTENEILHNYEISCGNVMIEKIHELQTSVIDCPGILLNSHGPFVWGSCIEDAFRHALLLEYIAELAFKTYCLNSNINSIPEVLHNKHFDRKHGSNAYYGQ